MQHHQCIFALISLDEYAIWAQRQTLIKSGQLFRWEDTMETHFYILQLLSEPHVWHHDMNSSLYPGSWVVTASSAGTFLSGNEFVGLFNQAHSSCCMGSLYLWSKLYVFSSRWRYSGARLTTRCFRRSETECVRLCLLTAPNCVSQRWESYTETLLHEDRHEGCLDCPSWWTRTQSVMYRTNTELKD